MNTTLHPLLLDIVLEKLFEEFSFTLTDLKRCRLVCKQWSEAIYPIMSTRCKDSILFGHSTRNTPLDKFIKAVRSGEKLPFTSFTLQPSLISSQRSQSIQDFFTLAGNYLTSLSITYQDHSHYLTSRDFTLSSLQFQNLSHLRFGVLPFDQFSSQVVGGGRTLGGEVLFQGIFQGSTNLIKLELTIPSDQRVLDVDPYISTITSSAARVHSSFIELILNCRLSQENIFHLQTSNYPLEMIRLKLREPRHHFQSFLSFIRSKAESLKVLKIDEWSTNPHMQFPCLANLHTLEILESKYFRNNSGMSPRLAFSYAKNLPNLTTLLFHSLNWRDEFLVFFPVSETVKTLCELKLPKRIDIDCSFLVNRISSAFPLLVKLQVFLDSDNISCLTDIFGEDGLCNLEDLSVCFTNWRGNKCIDSVITGIAGWACKEIYALCDISYIDLQGFRRRPCILDLKRLKRLQLRNMTMISEKGRPQYSDISGYHGFMLHKSLKILSIWPSQISEECLQRLGQRFSLKLHSF